MLTMHTTSGRTKRAGSIPVVIMIDDDETLLEAYELLFRQFLQEQFVFNGFFRLSEALEFLNSHDADLVLLDLVMPDNESVTESIQKLRQATPAVVVIHSAWGKLAPIAARAGADGFIDKTGDCDKFEAEIQRFVKLRR